MSEAHEHAEHIEHISHTNKKIALMIAVLALFLALAETLGKSAQTGAISDNVEASNLWAFYQAKTIRMTQILCEKVAMLAAVAVQMISGRPPTDAAYSGGSHGMV